MSPELLFFLLYNLHLLKDSDVAYLHADGTPFYGPEGGSAVVSIQYQLSFNFV